MKMNKWFMLGMVGLAFTACSNEEELGNQLPNGTGAVTINIVSPAMTKGIEAGTEDGSVKVVGPVTITLIASTGGSSIRLTAEQLAQQSSVTFWNVTSPSKVTVSMNGGQQSYTGIAPDNAAFNGIAPEAIPVYGETTNIKLSAETDSPTKDGSIYEEGAEEGDESKTFQLYKATVNLAIPVARLEVDGIVHVDEGECEYETLNIGGVYLDNVYATGNNVEYTEGTGFSCVSGINPTDYAYEDGKGTGFPAIWKDAAVTTDFKTASVSWPETDKQAYSYYFFGAQGADNLPKFKIYFSDSEAVDDSHPLPAPRFAMIKEYQNGQGEKIENFLPGHIYRITEAKIKDGNIYGDEGGENLYGVTVTVTEATWNVETITGVWQ